MTVSWRSANRHATTMEPRRRPSKVMPAVHRMRRAARPGQTVAWTAIAAAVGLSVVAVSRSGSDPATNLPPEADRPAQAALWAATAWRDSVALGRTPIPVAWETTPGYVRVTLDRGDPAGCVQIGVTTDGRFALAGPAAPIACPTPLAAATVEGVELAVNDPLARWTRQLAVDWLTGADIGLYLAPGVRLDPPPGYRTVDIDRVTSRQVDGRADVVAHGTADGLPVAVRLTVADRDGKYELVDVTGGLSATGGRTAGTLPTPTIPTTTSTSTSTSTTVATTTTGAPPPVTVSPTASTIDPPPPPPAAAGQ